MIAASIVELTALPAVIPTAKGAPAPSTPLFGDLLKRALKASGEHTPAAGAKIARRPDPDTENETTPGAIANLLAAALPQAPVVLLPAVLSGPAASPRLTTAPPTIRTTDPASAPPFIPADQVPPSLSPFAVAIQASTPGDLANSTQQNLTLNGTPVPPPPAIVTDPGVTANALSDIAAPAAPVHTSVAGKLGHWIENTVLSAVPSAIQSLNPLPTLHAVVHALSGAVADPTQTSVPKISSSAPATAVAAAPVPGDANGTQQQAATPPSAESTPGADPIALSLAPATAQQVAPLLPPNQVLPLTPLSPKSSSVAKLPSIAAAGAKDTIHANTVPVSGFQQRSAAYTPTGYSQHPSNQQNQAGTSTTDANVTVTQTNQATPQTMTVDHASTAAVATPPPPPQPLAAERTLTASELPTPVIAPPPPLTPAINTAKMIQSIGQTEMRVGMRSPEFGDISIRTSANRDLISAQISLDHPELARTLAVHLPDMQARLGGAQPMEVRIDMQGQAAGLSHGSSTGMANNSADHSRDDAPHRGNAAHAKSGEATASFFSASASAASDLRLNDRLDITA